MNAVQRTVVDEFVASRQSRGEVARVKHLPSGAVIIDTRDRGFFGLIGATGWPARWWVSNDGTIKQDVGPISYDGY